MAIVMLKMLTARIRSGAAIVLAALSVTACKEPPDVAAPPYAGVTLTGEELFVSARRWESKKLEWLAATPGTPDVLAAEPPQLKTLSAHGAIVFIHGYHAPAQTIATYFRGLTQHLHAALGYRGALVILDWPSEARLWRELSNQERINFMQLNPGVRKPDLSWEIGQYSMDGQLASTIGAEALLALLRTIEPHLQGKKALRIVAHSMGCRLVAEAMKRSPEAFDIVSSVVWLAPDLRANVLDEPVLRKALSRIGDVHIAHSRDDGVLRWLSGALQSFGGVARMLGADGPLDVTRIPSNVTLYDMTGKLGAERVHSAYLERPRDIDIILRRVVKTH
jgi:esterase/lipase superfamily enzyme